MKRFLVALSRAAFLSLTVVILLLSILVTIAVFMQSPVWGILCIGFFVFIYTFLYWLTEYKNPAKQRSKE